MISMKSVEIFILAGFLGAGKTTLLQSILEEEQEKDRKIAVIMNEMGKISIDSDSIPENIPFKELLNGCVCCTISDKLEIQLSELINQYELDAIYIEATGVAHPVEVLDTCLSPLLADKLRIQAIITLLDATCWMNRHKFKIPLQKLITEQVKHADTIILNKIDQISEASQTVIENELQIINPTGKIIPTRFSKVNLSTVQHIKRIGQGEHEKTHAIDHLHIKTYVHTFSHPINEKLFEDFLRTMPESVYRIKGYICFTGKPETFLFQYAYGMPLHTKSGLKMNMILVFIGDGLNHSNLQKTLNDLEENSLSLAH
jgi:G3E family GTPase